VFVPYDKEQDKNLILWIGRFTPGKGVEYLIDGFNILAKERPDLKLLMVGDGPSREYTKQKILELGLDKNIVMKEFVPNQEIPRIYQKSSVFVLPSIDEGVPRTILEAMACGIPVVCTELPQLVDIVKGCGITVPKRDPMAIAEAISKILSDKDLSRKLSENGRKNVVDNYSWKDTVNRTISLYEEVICQK
jgi:glycosyltransferase involved in cell wall biosynthesis